MGNRILIIITLLGFISATSLMAQEALPKNWNTQKIKGSRFIPYASYSGAPFLNEKFVPGEIEFLDGTKSGNIGLRYSSYRDEVIYFNTAISAQIIIDKISLNGFTFTDDNGKKRIFRRQYYDGYLHGERYFEVLSDGDVSLLAYRKVVLLIGPTYTDLNGKQKSMSYQEAYNYYIYNSKNGYELIKINRSSLLAKFNKPTQKLVRKLLRKNKVLINDEAGFVKAWDLVKENGININ